MDTIFNHYLHVNERLQLRYNIDITYEEYVSLNNIIRKPKSRAIFVGRRSKRISKWLILVKNRWVMVYYDKDRNCIVTVINKIDIKKIDELLSTYT